MSPMRDGTNKQQAKIVQLSFLSELKREWGSPSSYDQWIIVHLKQSLISKIWDLSDIIFCEQSEQYEQSWTHGREVTKLELSNLMAPLHWKVSFNVSFLGRVSPMPQQTFKFVLLFISWMPSLGGSESHKVDHINSLRRINMRMMEDAFNANS